MHLFTLSFSRYQFNSTMWASLSAGIMGSISPAPFYVMQMNTSKQTDTQTDRQTDCTHTLVHFAAALSTRNTIPWFSFSVFICRLGMLNM